MKKSNIEVEDVDVKDIAEEKTEVERTEVVVAEEKEDKMVKAKTWLKTNGKKVLGVLGIVGGVVLGYALGKSGNGDDDDDYINLDSDDYIVDDNDENDK